jgi:tRNA dimethylallyltransferase
VGKTALAVDLCLAAGGELISVDSRQLYRGVEIGSNAPTAAELRGVPAHLVGVLEVTEKVDARRFVVLAEAALAAVEQRAALPVLTAGTGLYLRALLDGYDLGGLPADPALRAELEAAAAGDLPALAERLRGADPQARVEPTNPVRVVRALELAILRRRGLTPETARRPPRPAVKVGLTAPREVRWAWIEARADAMLARGLVAEVERLLQAGVDPRAQALRGIGLAEVAGHLRGEISLEEARDRMVVNTRAYAKRQLTWFRADPEVRWFDAGAEERSDIVEVILEMLSCA